MAGDVLGQIKALGPTAGPGASCAEDEINTGNLLETASKRQKAHQEKNKRAQKRYRDRKKQQAEEQRGTIEELSKQLEVLRVSNTRLESRCQLLEKVVSLREHLPPPAQLGAPVCPP